MRASGTAGGERLPRIFISYRRQDAAPYAGRLFDDLAERFGEDHVFMDVEGIELGEDFEQVIVERIERADVVLAVVGPQWLTAADGDGRRRLDQEDDFVRKELEVALRSAVRLVPLLVHDARMPAPEELPAVIAAFARRQAFELTDRRWRAETAELMETLAALTSSPVEGTAVPAGVATRAGRSPLPPLPTHRTRFIGRTDDLKRVDELLASTGFVTIVGPGGVGKSRLALEAARAAEAEHPDGVGLAELAALDDPALVVAAVAGATAIDQRGQDVTLDRLVDALRDSQLLLILDNCEHLIEEAARMAEALVQRCPSLHLLATSREPLDVDGEAVWRLESLAVPQPSDAAPATVEVADSDAAVLFADRAALADPSFRLDEQSAPAIARLTAALDGLPLALELAAASLRTMTLDELVAGLTERPGVAGGRRRTSQARQRSLWDTVDWSYQLLDDRDRLLLERLGVFAGSFSGAVAESVCGAGWSPGTVPLALGGLVERSLVDRSAGDGAPDADRGERFRLLYTVRDYARSRLAARADDDTAARLEAWAVEVAEANGRAVDVGDELAGLAVLDAEHPNLVAVLAAALGAGDAATAGRLTAALAPYWELRGLRAEGLRWVEQALALSPADQALRAAGLLAASRLTPTGEFELRRQRARDALAAADEAGNDALAGAALASLGHIDYETEHREDAVRHVEAALARSRAAGDDAGVAVALMRLALYRQGQGDPVVEEQLLGQAASLFERVGNRKGQLWCLAELGFASLTTSDLDKARDAFQQGLELARQLGYRHGEAWMLDALGEAAGAAGRFDESRIHFEEAHAIQLRLGDELNRGWTLGGLVRAALGMGAVPDALEWLRTFTDYLHAEVAPLYEYALLLRAGSVAVAADHADVAAQVLGALDVLEAPESLSPTDLEDRRRLEEVTAAALTADQLAAARAAGRSTPPLELARAVVA